MSRQERNAVDLAKRKRKGHTQRVGLVPLLAELVNQRQERKLGLGRSSGLLLRLAKKEIQLERKSNVDTSNNNIMVAWRHISVDKFSYDKFSFINIRKMLSIH
tara:strand:- start:652 stop:960 length:309 start_codon:yes stop_codon:yes gene_type:complete